MHKAYKKYNKSFDKSAVGLSLRHFSFCPPSSFSFGD